MAILDQPFGPPPPAYSLAPSPATSGLPPGIWLQILGTIVRPSRPREEQLEGWATIHRELRLVCKDVYLVCMHLLRSHYLPSYLAHVRRPYSSDPYPSPGQRSISALPLYTQTQAQSQWPAFAPAASTSVRRETRVLDLFIAIKVKEEKESVESELLMSEGVEDLFGLLQAQSRLEDLILDLGIQQGTILPSASLSSSDSSRSVDARKLLSDDLSVRLSLRTASILLPCSSTASSVAVSVSATPRIVRKTVVEAPRKREDPLEVVAQNVLQLLGEAGLCRREARGIVWYDRA